MRLNPFRALRPAPALAAQVAAVPYDVVSREEAVELAKLINNATTVTPAEHTAARRSGHQD